MTTLAEDRSFRRVLDDRGPKKLLALDGGGILGVLSLEFLARIEATLRAQSGRGDAFVLADYFDYIGGTSTGAIIAACLALGMPVAKIQAFYRDHGKEMFDKDWLYKRHLHRYGNESLEALLKETIRAATGDAEATLATDRLRTLLMIVLRNATTDSPWPVSNNPRAKFNDLGSDGCNLHLPLWQLVRASTAAPTYFPPEVVHVGPEEFVFVDGGVTVYNNPALQLFLMATVDAYNLGWPAGEEDLLLVSIGTGAAPDANENLRPGQMNLLYNARSIPSALMAAASAQQDFLCRVLGRCRHGAAIDLELGPLTAGTDHLPTGQISLARAAGVAPSPPPGRLFSYVRYNVDLTQEGIDRLELDRPIRAADVRAMDSVDHIDELTLIGRAAARDVDPRHFRGFAA